MKYINDLIKGDTFKGFEVSLKRNGTAIDITGASILFQFKSISTNVLSDFEFKTENDTIIITNAVNGVFRVMPRIIDNDAGIYLCDLQITFANSEVLTLFQDKFKLIQDVSR